MHPVRHLELGSAKEPPHATAANKGRGMGWGVQGRLFDYLVVLARVLVVDVRVVEAVAS